MPTLILEPHNDDVALFAAYTAIRTSAHIVTVLESDKQKSCSPPITARMRHAESADAARIMGCTWEQRLTLDSLPEPKLEALVRADLAEVFRRRSWADWEIFAPANEEGGHDHHNLVADVAVELWGDYDLHTYTTYVRGFGRSARGREVEPEPEWIIKKLQALACFESQIRERATRPWFTNDPMIERLLW